MEAAKYWNAAALACVLVLCITSMSVTWHCVNEVARLQSRVETLEAEDKGSSVSQILGQLGVQTHVYQGDDAEEEIPDHQRVLRQFDLNTIVVQIVRAELEAHLNCSTDVETKCIIEPGPKGDPGPSGPPGPQGEKGDEGSRGDRGEKGDMGTRGSVGEKGERGDTGSVGPVGAKGEKGHVGFTGFKGQKGEVGDQGVQGPIGERGKKGDMGPRGPSGGEKGEQGDTGPKGQIGAKGEKGQLGRPGYKGETGANGIQGIRGPGGEKGEKGDVGPRGPSGGEKGEQGDTGPKGQSGAKGVKGELGHTGFKGEKGAEGERGEPGLRGGESDSHSSHYTCGGTTGWTRVAYLDMTNSSHYCPGDMLEVSDSGKRLCGRTASAFMTCVSAIFSTNGLQYSQVCGRITGYQYGHTDAFGSSPGKSLESYYVDGVSVTHGPPGNREHVWTFAAGYSESSIGYSMCPCAFNAPSFVGQRVPLFVGQNYFCESGCANVNPSYHTLYPDDPLWDGDGCSAGNTCCEFNKPPYFTRHLTNPTCNNLEVRACGQHSRVTNGGEDTLIELIELYVKQ